MALKHPAEEAVERIENGEDISAVLSNLTRAGKKYVIARTFADEWDTDAIEEGVFEGDGGATVTSEELDGLLTTIADAYSEGE